ncbi:MAG: hypothetical protein ABUS79_06195 [Pseudomonadota bacterium]
MHAALRTFLAGVGSTLVVLGWAGSAAAIDGTFHAGASTFANTDHNTVTFKVNPALAEGDQTTVSLNFAGDGASVTPAAEFVSAAKIDLAYAGTAQFSVNYGSGFSAAGSGVPANIILTKIGGSIGKYVLTINYNTPAGASALTGDWTLAFTNIAPTNARVLVTMNDGGNLTNLATVGVCATGTPTCPPGQSCKGPCPLCPSNYCVTHPWACYRERVWIPKWEPWRGPGPNPCLSCPIPWREKFGEEFEREIFSFMPLNKEGELLGAGQAKQIQLNFTGGRPVGDLVDVGDGEYAQMIESRKGEAAPRISGNIAGVAAPEFVAGSAAAAPASPLVMVLAILLLVALLGVGYFARRGSRGASVGR